MLLIALLLAGITLFSLFLILDEEKAGYEQKGL